MMALILITRQRIGALIDSHLERSPDFAPDYTALYTALRELAAEVLQEVDWGQVRVDGYYRGGNQEIWQSWLSEHGATYKGVVRLETAIMAVAYATDHVTRLEELSA